MPSTMPDMGSVRRIAPLATAATLVALCVAGLLARNRLHEIDWLRDLPRADAASAPAGPAVYSGRLYGPPGRATPSGEPAAAHWWCVIGRGDEEDTVYCKGRDRSLLVLETPAGRMPIAWAGAPGDEVGLITDEQDDEYGRRFTIDLGSIPATALAAVPAGTCPGEGGHYEQYLIPQGAPVEVAGCARAGAIDGCEGSMGGVLATPDLDADRRHRSGAALGALRIALAVSAALLLGGGLLLAAQIRWDLLPLRRGGRR